jgi:hypothetical protein
MKKAIFTFADVETGQPCRALVTSEIRGLCIKPEGTATSDGDFGPIFLEIVNRKLVLYVWPDVNEQEPIKIDLTDTLESNRLTSIA